MPQLLSVIKPSDSYIIQKLQSICKSYPVNFLNFLYQYMHKAE